MDEMNKELVVETEVEVEKPKKTSAKKTATKKQPAKKNEEQDADTIVVKAQSDNVVKATKEYKPNDNLHRPSADRSTHEADSSDPRSSEPRRYHEVSSCKSEKPPL